MPSNGAIVGSDSGQPDIAHVGKLVMASAEASAPRRRSDQRIRRFTLARRGR
jgi:hypothetical protein